MRNNWFVSKLVVLFCLWGMLGTLATPVAEAKVHQPFHCWTCCPPQCQDDGPYDDMQYWNSAVVTVAYGNTVPTQAQFDLAARYIWKYAAMENENGDLAKAQAAVIASIHNGSFYTQGLDATLGTETIVAYGGAVTKTALQAQMNQVELSHRQTAAAYILTYGLYAFYRQYADYLIQFGEEYGTERHPRTPREKQLVADILTSRYYVHQPKDIMVGFFLGAVAAGTVLTCFTGIPEAVGLGILVGAAIGSFAYWACCQELHVHPINESMLQPLFIF